MFKISDDADWRMEKNVMPFPFWLLNHSRPQPNQVYVTLALITYEEISNGTAALRSRSIAVANH